MKKTVLLALLTMVMVGCKDKVPAYGGNADTTKPGLTECIATTTEAFKKLPIECQNNELIRGLLCAGEDNRVQWLKDNGQKICTQNLYECIEPLHRIEDISNFETLASAHPENKEKIVYYEKMWKEVKDALPQVSCYEAYLTFVLEHKKLTLDKVKDFTVERSCYSLPFLISLEKKYKLGDTDKVYFTKALVNVTINEKSTEMEKVFFKIEKNNLEAAYYDLSDFPGMTDFYIPCGL